MAAPVRREAKVDDDPRYDALALLMGLADRDHAVGKMMRLWSWQTNNYTDEAPTYAVPRSIVIGIFLRKDAPEILVESGLAEFEPDGRIRPKGGRDDKGKSRIDWLYNDRKKKQEAGRNGGKASAAKARKRVEADAADDTPLPSCLDFAAADHSDSSENQANEQQEPSRDQAGDQRQTTSLFSDLLSQIPDHTLPRTIPGATVAEIASEAPTQRQTGDRLLGLTEKALRAHREAEGRLHRELKLSTPPPAIMANAATEASALRVVQSWVQETDDATDPEITVRERLAHLVAVRSAVAKSVGHLRYWSPSTFWDPNGIERDLRQTPEQAAAGNSAPASGFRPGARTAPAPAKPMELGPDGFKRGMPPVLRSRRA